MCVHTDQALSVCVRMWCTELVKDMYWNHPNVTVVLGVTVMLVRQGSACANETTVCAIFNLQGKANRLHWSPSW